MTKKDYCVNTQRLVRGKTKKNCKRVLNQLKGLVGIFLERDVVPVGAAGQVM